MRVHKQKQSGVALIVGLLLLLLLTIIMITAIQVTVLEHRMASNMKNQNVAFQAAETALREAEVLIDSGITEFNPLRLYGLEDDLAAPFRATTELSCVNGLCTRSGIIQPGVFPDVSEAEMRTASTGLTTLTTITTEPKFVIELIDTEYSVHSGWLKQYQYSCGKCLLVFIRSP